MFCCSLVIFCVLTHTVCPQETHVNFVLMSSCKDILFVDHEDVVCTRYVDKLGGCGGNCRS